MENIRLPEDFTDRVMQRIEVRERAAVRRARAAAVTGGILGGAAVIAAAVIILRRYGIDLSLLIGTVSDFLSRLSALLHSALTIPAGPVTGIALAVPRRPRHRHCPRRLPPCPRRPPARPPQFPP